MFSRECYRKEIVSIFRVRIGLLPAAIPGARLNMATNACDLSAAGISGKEKTANIDSRFLFRKISGLCRDDDKQIYESSGK